MTKRERIIQTMNFEKADRVPLLGGFFVSGTHYQGITGVSENLFSEEPSKYAILAYQELDVDGLILLRLPPGREGHFQYRSMTKESFYSYKQRYNSPEDVLAYVESLPSPEETLKSFDAQSWTENLVKNMKEMQRKVGEMVWMPTRWEVVHPGFEWYNVFV